jgi:hypothetical protein
MQDRQLLDAEELMYRQVRCQVALGTPLPIFLETRFAEPNMCVDKVNSLFHTLNSMPDKQIDSHDGRQVPMP